MRMFLGGMATLVILVFSGIFIYGWLVENGKLPDPRTGRTASGPQENKLQGPVSRAQDAASVSGPAVQLREKKTGDVVSLGQEQQCAISYDENQAKTLLETNEHGKTVHTGQLRIWWRADCVPGTKETHDSPYGGDPWEDRFTVRETRLLIDCNDERFWAEYTRYSENGRTVYEWKKNTGDSHSKPSDGLSLDVNADGEIISPSSRLATVMNRYCPSLINLMEEERRSSQPK